MSPRPASSDGSIENGASLRSVARYACWLGALASLAITIYAGRHNRSVLLVTLFVGWTFLPYLGLMAADRLAARARRDVASATHAASVLLALVPPGIYAVVSTLMPGHPATFAFLVVPAATWLAIATLLIAVRLQRRPHA